MAEIMPGVTVSGVEVYGINTPKIKLENDSVIKGRETYDMDNQIHMAPPIPQGPDQLPHGGKNKCTPIILVNPKEKSANIYLNATTQLSSPEYVTPLCVFLDSAPPDMTIRMYLGSYIDDVHTIGISSIIASMQKCRAQLETYAYGMCSVPETMIWTYGKKKEIGKYGTIKIGGGEWIRRMEKAFKPYIQTYMDHCKKLGLLNDEQINDVVVKQKEFSFMLGDNNNIVIIDNTEN